MGRRFSRPVECHVTSQTVLHKFQTQKVSTQTMSAHAFSFFFSKRFKYLGDICTCACLYTILNITENKLILNNFYRTKRQCLSNITSHPVKNNWPQVERRKKIFLNLCWSFKYEELKSWSTCPLQDLPAVWYKATRDATDPRLPPSIYKEDKACFSRDYTFRRTKISWTVKMKNKACLGYVCTCFVQFSWKRQVFLV